jgi:hypothetical protein
MSKNIVSLDRSKFQIEIEGVNVNLPIGIIKSLPLSGEVYLIKCCDFYKIGASAQLRKRLSSIQTAVPFDIEFIDSFVSCDVFQDEKRLHLLCAEFNFKNEWFALPKSFAKNRSNWFKPEVSPIKQIRRGMIDYIKATDYEFESRQERFGLESLGHISPNEEYLRVCFSLNVEIDTQIIAARFGVEAEEVHDNRYQGLYCKNMVQLKQEARLGKTETPLDALSTYDLALNDLANQRAKMMGNPNAIFAVANTLREGHEKDMGSPLKPTWEEKRLRPNQAKAIAYSPEYQTELPVA